MRLSARPRAALVAALLLLAPLAAARAQDDGEGRLAIHGYLTQGYGAADGARFYGLRSQGSSDFRVAALQVRYDRDDDGVLIQLNHRRLGESRITDFESNVNLNWAFYERRSKSGLTTVKVGRVPVPRGIYNELRNVGVVLPMYRAPVIFYDEGAYFSETLDGATVAHAFRDGKPWSLDVSAYFGGWSLLAYDQSGDEYTIGRVRAENGYGTQLWLNTPVEGVRLGAAAQAYDWENRDETGGVTGRQSVWEVQGSLDATFSRAFLRAETLLQNYDPDDYYANYVQVGVGVTPKLWLVGLGEYAYERNYDYGVPTYPKAFVWHRAAGAALNYRVSPTFVLKAEHHWNKGVQVEQATTPATAPRFQYYLLSASASF